jgi:dATP pyrophosphohydrolase
MSEGRRLYLLLRRVSTYGGFWQPVTGSLEDGESHREAAVREVREETGVRAAMPDLIDLGLINRFVIAPEWRGKYAPGVTHNEEVCFALKVNDRAVLLDPVEHDAYVWVDYETALEMLYWDSSKKALRAAEAAFR